MRQSSEELHAATIKCWSNERGTDPFLPSSRCSVSSMTTCTLEQLPDFLWMPPHHKPGKQRQHSSFNQQMSKEKHTECLLPSQSFLKRWQGFGIRRSTPDVPPHFFKSHRECVCVQQQHNPVQNRTARAPKSASLLQLRRRALIGRLHALSYPHTHTGKVSSAFFPPLTFPILSLALSLSLALHLWLYLRHFIF